MAKLIFIDEKFNGRTYELVVEKTVVGRADKNTLVIRDESVSSSHCEILLHGAEIIVVDLGSRNGTFVNGVRLDKQSGVKSGQTIRFGNVEARLELDPADSGTEASEITAVHAHGRALRDQRRKRARPGPADPHATVESMAPELPDADEHTVLVPKPGRAEPEPAVASALAPGQAPPPGGPRSSAKTIMIWVALACGLLLLAWLIWGRK